VHPYGRRRILRKERNAIAVNGRVNSDDIFAMFLEYCISSLTECKV